MTNFELFETTLDRSHDNSLKMSMLPKEIKEEGLQSFWGAEFCFPTCPAYSRGVIEWAKRGSYPFIMQNEAYNKAVCGWMEMVREWKIDTEWIVPVHGTIFGLATAIRMFVTKEKALLMFDPGYYRYKQAADRMGFPTISCALKKEGMSYSLDFEKIEEHLKNEQVGLIVLNNPNNPTGTIFDKASLEKLDALSRKYQVPVYSDEIFAEVVLPGNEAVLPFSKISGEDGLGITCTSLGKCMSLTGVNHANLIIPNGKLRENYIKQKYADHYGSIDPCLHAGLLEAYSREGADFVKDLSVFTKENAALFIQRLKEILPKAKAEMPQGTYVVWVDYSELGLSDEELEELLHKRGKFLGDPGCDYGVSNQFYRYCITMPKKEMERCFLALEEGVKWWYENH